MFSTRLAKQILKKLGLFSLAKITLQKLRILPKALPGQLETILQQHKMRGTNPNSIIDVGASDGRWSQNVMQVFPDAFYALIEANTIHEARLKEFVREHRNADYTLAAAGNNIGKVYFDDSDPLGGLASHKKTDKARAFVPMITIDHIVKAKNLKGPFLIKLDTHGFEVPIFEGARKTLRDTHLIVVEVYNFQIAKNSLLFFEMCEYLRKKGFRPAGLVDIAYRPKDNFLWQLDIIFFPSTREEFSDNQYL